MRPAELEYSGVDVLEALQEAENYNSYLTALVARCAGSERCVLDFGAGIGTFSDLLQQRGFQVRCVEPDERLAGRLRSKGFQTVTDLTELPDESLDFVFTLNVFEHIENDAQVMQVLVRKLKADGRLLIYVPAYDSLWTALDERVHHYRRYTSASLRALVATAGLEPVECRYADSLGYLAAWVFKFIGNKEGKLSPRAVRLYDRFVMPLSIVLDGIFSRFLGKNVYALCTKVISEGKSAASAKRNSRAPGSRTVTASTEASR